MPTKNKIYTKFLGNPIDMFTSRLLGADYKDAFQDDAKMYKIAASIQCATSLTGLDGSLKERDNDIRVGHRKQRRREVQDIRS